jgi:hypothetical protein
MFCMLSIHIMIQRCAAGPELTTPALIGLLVAACGGVRLPARSWALGMAIEVIESIPMGDSSLRRACRRVPRGDVVGARFRALDKAFVGLVSEGHVVPDGSGWNAGFSPTEPWLARHAQLALKLGPADRSALRKAAQRLKAALSTWSKNAVASDPVGSARI